LSGEFTILDSTGAVMPRKTGNGLLNKFIKGTGDLKIAGRVIYEVWDVLSSEDFMRRSCDIPYADRWNTLVTAMNMPNSTQDNVDLMLSCFDGMSKHRISLIETEEVETIKDADDFYTRMRDEGHEGAIVKDTQALWKDNTSPLQVKMKHFVQGEFEITHVIEGKGKFKGKMGAIGVKSSEGIITCNVGSGFSDKDRESIEFWEDMVGGIVTIQFESIIEDKKTKKKSLFIPTFVEARFNEKTVADSYEYLKELIK
jgi:hypothetical protein